MQEKIKKLIKSSKKVIIDCSLENGAIVAANSIDNDYPSQAKNYFYVWPRDASYACIAADVLGMEKIQDKFFKWVEKNVVSWKEDGIFYEKYYVNGLEAMGNFQPGQSGIFLYALWHHIKTKRKNIKEYKFLITNTANGICKNWDKNKFKGANQDLWEERFCFPDVAENFTYSLSACISGLEKANQLIPSKNHFTKIKEMKDVLKSELKKESYIPRTIGKFSDKRIDASALGLIWPFETVKLDSKIATKTIKLIEKKLVKNFGVHRYEEDEYDGWMYRMLHRRKGAGFWPLLNFWFALVLNQRGEKVKALKYFNKGISRVKGDIPEQIFNNNYQKAVSPLCWSHVMFVLASKELGYLEK